MKLLPEIHLNELLKINRENIDIKKISGEINLPSEFRPKFRHDDLTPLLLLLKEKNPQLVLEIGTGRGNTVANVCANTDAHVITVNALPQQISGKKITFTLSEEEVGKAYKKLGYSHRVTQIFENTLRMDLGIYCKPESVDFVIIDACHDTPFVINDFFKVEPFIKKNGIVLFHDTHPSMKGHLKGSYKACLKLRKKGFDIKYLINTWWGIWIKI